MVKKWPLGLLAAVTLSCGDTTSDRQNSAPDSKAVGPIKMVMMARVEPAFKDMRKRVLCEVKTDGVAELQSASSQRRSVSKRFPTSSHRRSWRCMTP